MGTMQLPAVSTPLKNLSSPRLTLNALESRLADVEAEMEFYHKLLSWLLFSCEEEKRHTIETYRAALADLRNGRFSALSEGLERLKNERRSRVEEHDLFADLAHLQLYFNHVNGALYSLKSKIQRDFSDFTHVCIW